MVGVVSCEGYCYAGVSKAECGGESVVVNRVGRVVVSNEVNIVVIQEMITVVVQYV